MESAAPGRAVQVDAEPMPDAYPTPSSETAPVIEANIAAMATPTMTVAAVAIVNAVADEITGTLLAAPAAGVSNGGVMAAQAVL